MKKTHLYIGLDVHKDTISVALAEKGNSEVRHYGNIPGDLPSFEKLTHKLLSTGKPLHFVYEAGPCGYTIYRFLRNRHMECLVVSPTSIPKRVGHRIKTDRRDALELARLHRAGELTGITVPDPEDEAIRDLVRAREDAIDEQRRARLRLKSLLLRNGIRYPGTTSWTPAHLRWLSEHKMLFPSQQIAFQEYLHAITESTERVERLSTQVIEAARVWRFMPLVLAYQAFRGLKLISAITLAAELGDLTRFSNPTPLMSFVGLVPCEHSSGNSVHRGSITKAGNHLARRVLIEAAWAYRQPARVTRTLRLRIQNQPRPIQQLAWKAQLRLCTRYRHFLGRRKKSQIAVTALARELVGFLWEACRLTMPQIPESDHTPIRTSHSGFVY